MSGRRVRITRTLPQRLLELELLAGDLDLDLPPTPSERADYNRWPGRHGIYELRAAYADALRIEDEQGRRDALRAVLALVEEVLACWCNRSPWRPGALAITAARWQYQVLDVEGKPVLRAIRDPNAYATEEERFLDLDETNQGALRHYGWHALYQRRDEWELSNSASFPDPGRWVLLPDSPPLTPAQCDFLAREREAEGIGNARFWQQLLSADPPPLREEITSGKPALVDRARDYLVTETGASIEEMRTAMDNGGAWTPERKELRRKIEDAIGAKVARPRPRRARGRQYHEDQRDYEREREYRTRFTKRVYDNEYDGFTLDQAINATFGEWGEDSDGGGWEASETEAWIVEKAGATGGKIGAPAKPLVAAFAEILGCSKETIYRARDRGQARQEADSRIRTDGPFVPSWEMQRGQSEKRTHKVREPVRAFPVQSDSTEVQHHGASNATCNEGGVATEACSANGAGRRVSPAPRRRGGRHLASDALEDGTRRDSRHIRNT
jgi:hypothetical protein